MISGLRDLKRDRRVWAAAVILSALVHFTVLPLAVWVWLEHFLIVPLDQPPREQVIATTAVRIERRPVPQPRNRPVPQPPQPRQAPASQPVAPRPEVARARPNSTPQPTSLPSATPQPRPVKPLPLEQQLAQQERQFSRQVAQLKSHNDPMSIATTTPEKPAAFHRATFDVSGTSESEAVQAVITPIDHWNTSTLSCYYVKYEAQGPSGNEDGTIPWPVCYPQSHDPLAVLPPGSPIAVPYPQPGYVLPAGTYLSPILKQWYESVQRP